MATIFNYIATMDAVAVDNPTGNGFCALSQPLGSGTATCGVVAAMALPMPSLEASADWEPLGRIVLPALDSTGTTAGYHPAWGAILLPAMTADAQAHAVIDSKALLPTLFAVGYTGAAGMVEVLADASALAGARGEVSIMLDGLGADIGLHRHGSGAATMPLPAASGLSCGLDKPIDNGATSAAVVALLQQGNLTLAEAAASICAYDDTDDDRAMSVTYFVSNLMAYVQDSASGIGDRWTCALATWLRKYGDCEDGAILIHALLLAAGVDPGRVRTAMGLVMTTDLVASGHAWVMYRRLTDEEWIPLEWTFQPSPYDREAWQINRQVDMAASYTKISYILTNEAFYAVNDANYIPKLAANRSTASAGLPALSATSQTGQAARGAVTLFAGTLATTLTASGQAGARAVMSMPVVAGDGMGSQLATGQASCAVPPIDVSGGTGAMAAATLARAVATGQCGTSGKSDLALPILALSATGTAAAVVGADLLLPRPVAQGAGVVGIVVDGGDVAFPSVRSTGRAVQGPLALGACALPRLGTSGEASPLSTGAGELVIQGLAVRAQGKKAVSWAGPLTYSDSRWT